MTVINHVLFNEEEKKSQADYKIRLNKLFEL